MNLTRLVSLTGCGRNFDLGCTDLKSLIGIKLRSNSLDYCR